MDTVAIGEFAYLQLVRKIHWFFAQLRPISDNTQNKWVIYAICFRVSRI